ncbi:MAG TPA: WbqC family protein [Bacteroidales bacterium]|nr:WbqC family protein [Bacteroidales bacterium]
MLLPCFYNAPVSYFGLILQADSLQIEVYDHYSKQTYRNRCKIFGANGIINLSIPVKKVNGNNTYVKDIEIDYTNPWNLVHWKSICSAYRSSPFFELMEDSFAPFYQKRFKYLTDLNLGLMETTLDHLQWSRELIQTKQFDYKPVIPDCREIIHPKRQFTSDRYNFTPQEYYQVFKEKHGFKKDLSILDLLFNEGPNAGGILKRSIDHSNPAEQK